MTELWASEQSVGAPATTPRTKHWAVSIRAGLAGKLFFTFFVSLHNRSPCPLALEVDAHDGAQATCLWSLVFATRDPIFVYRGALKNRPEPFPCHPEVRSGRIVGLRPATVLSSIDPTLSFVRWGLTPFRLVGLKGSGPVISGDRYDSATAACSFSPA